MLKSIALWLFPDLVSRQLLDDANELLLQRIDESKQLRSQLHSEETDKCRFRDDLNKASVQLDAMSKALEATQVELQACYAAWKAESEEKNVALKSAESVRDAIIARIETTLIDYDNRDLKQKPQPIYSKLIANHRAILDEIGRIVTTAKNLALKS